MAKVDISMMTNTPVMTASKAAMERGRFTVNPQGGDRICPRSSSKKLRSELSDGDCRQWLNCRIAMVRKS
jgi:hypothetical protein